MKASDKILVQKLEACYDQLQPRLNQLQASLEEFREHYDDYLKLREFYGSEKWFELAEQDSDDVKSGILSEDQLYNLIGDHNQLLADFLELSSKMYHTL